MQNLPIQNTPTGVYRPVRKCFKTPKGKCIDVVLYAGGPYFKYWDIVHQVLNSKANHEQFGSGEFRYFMVDGQKSMYVTRTGLMVMCPKSKEGKSVRKTFLQMLTKRFSVNDPPTGNGIDITT